MTFVNCEIIYDQTACRNRKEALSAGYLQINIAERQYRLIFQHGKYKKKAP
jgi:hypothetical protein